jgi:glycosyltransferase involved in cell wall biosynthesis
MDKKSVLIFISYYLPGFKMGGPIKSVQNITKKLNENYNLHVIASDRDMGDDKPYEHIKQKEWIEGSDSKIMYLKTDIFYFFHIVTHLRKNSYDIIYLNSFFTFKFSIFIVLIDYFKLAGINKIVITPRGELFDEALAFGRFKKKMCLKIFKALRIYNNVTWHSTGVSESQTILKHFPTASVKLARVISDNAIQFFKIDDPVFCFEDGNFLKLIFLSRISKDKNLLYAIKLLGNVTFKVEYHIYGPIEDESIWRECIEEIEKLPANVRVIYKGEIERKYVQSYFVLYDLFLFPTLRENFGHVISEALSVGTPVLISDKTPWRNLSEKNLGWDISLRNQSEFIKVLNEFNHKKLDENYDFRRVVRSSYLEFIDEDEIIKENIDLFKEL